MRKLCLKLILIFSVLATFFTACEKDGTAKTDCEEVQERLNPLLEKSKTDFASYFTEKGNIVTNPGFTANSIKPMLLNELFSSPSNSFFSEANYYGAVNPNSKAWYKGWSFLERIIQGEITDIDRSASLLGKETVTVSGHISSNRTFVKDTIYMLEGLVFVDNNATLTIESGTVIKATAGQGAAASALIITREAKIEAVGTKTEPIIFTAASDALDGTTTASTRGLWGGVILLGKASLNSGAGESVIEGVPTSELGAIYGGNNDAHSSGLMRYVSIRHTGTDIGAGNEIQGLTLGGVGRGTTLEYIESIGSMDDGFEWFGGTVNAKYLISAYNGDDALDYDEGYRGMNQFVIVYQDPSPGAADRGGEHDGGTDPETGSPYATPIFYNVSSIGNPEARALTFRDNAGGEYHNSIFVNYAKAVDIELKDSEQNSYKQFVDGRLKLENNVFYNIGAGNNASDLFKISVDNTCYL